MATKSHRSIKTKSLRPKNVQRERGGKGPKPRRQSGGSCCSWHTRLSWQGMSTGSQGCYGNIWESTYSHTALSLCTCVLCVRFGSAYTCSLLIRHVVRSQKPLPDTSVRPPIKAVAMHRARRTAARMPGGTSLRGSHKANAAVAVAAPAVLALSL